jgi:prevent-host-death family protein
MRSVGIKVLKNKLSEYVRLAANGETVLVTDRARVVAELVPPRAEVNDVNPRWAEAVRQGYITPAKNPGGPIPKGIGIMTLAELMEDLDRDRADR